MSSDRDTARIVRSWLEDGVTVLPDRVLDAVLDQVPATPQRRPWRPAWRFRTVNGLPRIAAVAATAVLGVIIGLALFNMSANVGQPTHSPSPTAITTPAALDNLPDTVTLAAGTYSIDADFPVRVSFTLPAGWNHAHFNGQHVILSRGDLGLVFMTVLNVYTNPNPCKGPDPIADPPIGPSVDDLVTALIHLPGTDVGTVSDVSIDGSQGKSFDLHVQRCDGNLHAQNLLKPSNQEFDGFTANYRARLHFYVMDVQGQRIVMVTTYADGSPNVDADKAELQTIVDSIHIAPRGLGLSLKEGPPLRED